jgi:hypothetical protein
MNPNHLLEGFHPVTRGAVSKVPCFMGLFEKAAGCRGGAPLVSISEFILTFMKTIYLFCF